MEGIKGEDGDDDDDGGGGRDDGDRVHRQCPHPSPKFLECRCVGHYYFQSELTLGYELLGNKKRAHDFNKVTAALFVWTN
jgi:hypothetical protein